MTDIYHNVLVGDTDYALIDRARRWEGLAWGQLVMLYGPLVDLWCRQEGLQQADVCDLRQEVFLAVAHKIDGFHRDKPGDTFRGWLRGITRNLLNFRRRKLRKASVVGVQLAEGELEQLPDSAALDSDIDARSEETAILYRRALEIIQSNFEESSWQAFWFTVIDGRRPTEVAAELGISINAVYLAKGRVLAKLREEFVDLIKD